MTAKPVSIAVVGSGYVGLVAAVCFAEIGHSVVCVDNDEQKVAMLREGGVPIHEDFLPELLDRHRNKRLAVHHGPARGHAECAGDFYRGGHAAIRHGQCRSVVRGRGGDADCALHRQPTR